MAFRRSFRSVVAIVILSLGSSAAVHAGFTESRTMHLTFGTSVTLPGIVLAPGTYVFELASPRVDPWIVRVLSEDRSTVYFMGFTRSVPRPAGQARPVSFGEAPPGRPVPITAWYPPGDSQGRRFIYRERDQAAGLAGSR